MSFNAWKRFDGSWMITHQDCDGSAESCAKLGCLREVDEQNVQALLANKNAETAEPERLP